jgi:nucleoside 2-deoxyribosyltransferase
MMTKSYKVYLAGAISGLTYGECTDWRQYVIDQFPPEIKGYSPLRAKTYLADLANAPIAASATDLDKMGRVMSTARGIMTRDVYDVRSSDVVLVNFLGTTKPSIGTTMEIAWAWDRHIPVVCAMEESGNPHDHAMITEALGFRVPTLDEAIHIVKCILLPVGH